MVFDDSNVKIARSKVRFTSPYSRLVLLLEQVLTTKNVWSESLLNDIPKHWERHGDLLIFPSTAFTDPVWCENREEVYNVITSVLNCERLAQKSTVLSDGYRTPQVKLLKGSDGWVQRVDNGIKFTFDVTHCMFSFGNITEKLRIAQFDCSGETVVDLYAGIGYFTLPFLVHAGAGHVHACEWNPEAVGALKRNLSLNKIASDRCTIHEGNNQDAGLSDVADRVNLGLLPSSRSGWAAACSALRRESGGILHVHQNVDSAVAGKRSPGEAETEAASSSVSRRRGSTGCSATQTLNDSRERHRTSKKTKWTKKCRIYPEWESFAREACRDLQVMLEERHGLCWTTSAQHIECVKFYAPHVAHIVVDVECRPRAKSVDCAKETDV